MRQLAKLVNSKAARLTRLKLLSQAFGVSGVAEHVAIDDVGDVSFEDSHGLSSRVASR